MYSVFLRRYSKDTGLIFHISVIRQLEYFVILFVYSFIFEDCEMVKLITEDYTNFTISYCFIYVVLF